MKKWLFFIVPLGLTLIFTFFYLSHVKEAEAQVRVQKAEAARLQKEQADRQADIEEKARQDAARRSAERAAAEAKKEAERIAAWEAVGKEIQSVTDKNNTEADEFARKIAKMEIELDALRQSKAKLNAEVLNQSKAVQLALIAKRTAELEVQRRTDMVRRRAEESSLVQMPAPVPSR